MSMSFDEQIALALNIIEGTHPNLADFTSFRFVITIPLTSTTTGDDVVEKLEKEDGLTGFIV